MGGVALSDTGCPDENTTLFVILKYFLSGHADRAAFFPHKNLTYKLQTAFNEGAA